MGASLYLVGLLWPAWFPSEAGTWEDATAEVCMTVEARRTDLGEAELRAAMEAGVSVWFAPADGGDRACGGFSLGFDAGPCRARSDGRDGRTELYFREDWPHGPATIGFTASTVDTGRTCRVVDDDQGVTRSLPCRVGSDIELNDDTVWWGRGGAVGVDVRTVVAHEVGHLLGLGHCEENGTCGPGEALMFGGYTGALPGPAEDDDEGLCALYEEAPAELGEACGRDAACGSGVCGAFESAAGRCARPCGGGCAEGQSCAEALGLCEGSSVVCGACGQDGDCGLDALCVDGTCRPRCGAGCPNGTVCGVGADGRRSCLGGCPGEPRSPEGALCDDRACEPGLVCAEGRCLRACGETPCPSDRSCTERFGGRYCLPTVVEGEACDDGTLCAAGPCLVRSPPDSSPTPTCLRGCVGVPCGPGQSCEVVSLRPGSATRVCTPPAPPPSRPDLGPGPDLGAVLDGGRGPDLAGGRPPTGAGAGGGPGPPIEGSSCRCTGAGPGTHGGAAFVLATAALLLALGRRERPDRLGGEPPP